LSRARGELELCAGADLTDHEVTQKLTYAGKDLLGAEDLAELSVLITFRVVETIESSASPCDSASYA
jgi:hypothetical protein